MGRRRKGESKPDDARIEARRQRAFEMRRGGGSYRAIGQALGISHEQARKDVEAVMEQVNAESREMATEYRSIQIERLDAMLTAVWPRALSYNKDHPQAQLNAIDRVLRIEERRAKLLGLDAPQKFQHEDWRSQAVADIRAGAITFDSLARVFDEDLATELFKLAGVPVE